MIKTAVRNQATELIFSVIDEINRIVPEEKRLEKSTETILVGHGGNLDSLGLINFLVTLEQKIEKEFSASINLKEDTLVTSAHNYFETVGTLSNHLCLLLQDQDDGNVDS